MGAQDGTALRGRRGGLEHMLTVDFGRTAADYAQHRAGFPDAWFEWLALAAVATRGARVLDLGTGTGSVAHGFALRGAVVTAIDLAEAQLEAARERARAAGVEIRYLRARAERTGLPDGAFDVVTAGQCWHWFDRPAAAREAARVLVPGGRIVLAHFDWVPLPGNVAHATERLIEAHNSSWTLGGGTGLYPAWLADLAGAGFGALETHSFDLVVPYTHAAWRGRIRASAGVGAVLPHDAVARFDAALAALLGERFPAEPLLVPHRVWSVLARR